MTEELIAALTGLVLAAIGWLTSWLRAKSKGRLIDSMTSAIEQVDHKDTKKAIDRVTKGQKVWPLLDKILKAKGLALLGFLVLTGCSLLGTGATGATPELGQATATSNPKIVVNIYFYDRQEPAQLDKYGIAVSSSVTYGEDCNSAEVSSGGGGTAGTQGGSGGDLTIPIPGAP